MRDTQAFVLSQLELYKLLEDEAITFLRVALSYDKPLYVLIFKGLSLLAYRRQEITQQEAALLGRRGTDLLAYSREKIRETLRLLLRGECLHYRGVPALLTVLREHAMDVFIQVLRNMSPPEETSVRSSKNIFAMPNVVAQCDDCVSFESARQKLFQTVFNEVVGQSILDKFPPRSTSEGQDNGPGAQANEPNPQADAQVDGLGAQTNTDSED
ncbi:hypothetical protein BN14_05272 [Rhizoctonia solani AG-1 IB]|nr:hypothetical protein BN14_05272 [Rhizoctonia solani AG-1 IB]